MGFLDKLKKKEPASDEQVSGKSASTFNPRRKQEQVLRESVFETVAVTCRKNKPFVVKRDDDDLYVGAYLPLDRIGGLSVKDRNDESKGSIITLINSGNIAVLFTSELAKANAVVFIPTKSTLEQMGEYSLLAEDLQYELCVIDPSDESIELCDTQADLAMLQKICSGKAQATVVLDRFLKDTSMAGAGDAEAPSTLADEAVASAAASEPAPAATAAFGGDYNSGTFGAVDDGVFAGGGSDAGAVEDTGAPDDGGAAYNPAVESSSSSYDDDDDDEDEDDEDEAASDDDSGETETVFVDPATSQRALARKFFNSDLTRNLNTDGLDQALQPGSDFVGIAKREDGWLADQLNLMADVANRDLLAIHQQNLTAIRQKYLDTMGDAYVRIMQTVLKIDDDPRYKILLEAKAAQEKEIPRMVAEEKNRLEKNWEERLKEAGDAARVQGEKSYRDRYRYQHEEAVRMVDSDMRDGINAAFERAVGELKDIRRREAEAKLDALDSETIQALQKEYADLLQSECQTMDEQKAQFQAFLERNREDEIARIRVLNDELKRDNSVEKVQAECAERVKALTEEFEGRKKALESDIEQMRTRHAVDLENKDREMKTADKKHQEETGILQRRIDALLSDVSTVEERKTREVSQRMNDLIADRDNWQTQYDNLQRTRKHSYTLVVAMAVIGVIIALLVGFLVGRGFGKPAPVDDKLSTSAVSSQVVPVPDSSAEPAGSGEPAQSSEPAQSDETVYPPGFFDDEYVPPQG